MAGIRTILGDITAEEFGICDFHDHLIRSYGPEIRENAWYLMNDVEAASVELQDWIDAGGRPWYAWIRLWRKRCAKDVEDSRKICRKSTSGYGDWIS